METPFPDLPAVPSFPASLPPPPTGSPPTPRRRRWIAVALLVAVAVTAIGGVVSSAPPARSSDFRFLQRLPNGSPYRWDPCQPIHWTVHLQDAPAGALPIVQQAIGRVADATGIRFIFDGPTDLGLRTYQEQLFRPIAVTGRDWLPVLIDWSTHAEFTAEVGSQNALAFGFPVDGQGDDVYTYRSGAVVIDAGQSIPTDFASRFSLGPVVMHEMAHVMGLGHVAQGNELMWSPQVPGATRFPDVSETSYGPGDLQGLHDLGSGAPCGSVPLPSAASSSP